MNKIFDTPATSFFMPDYLYVILVDSVPLYGFNCLESAKRVFDIILDYNPLVVVSLVFNAKYANNKETVNV